MYQEITLKSFRLENDFFFEELTVAFHTFGRLNPSRSNVIWVCHGLTANSDVLDWWQGLFGDRSLFNPDQHFIVCVNALGSCYGTSGPSRSESTSPALSDRFPLVTTRDQARLFERVRQELGLGRLYTLIGASLGGQQALEWSAEVDGLTDHLIVIATNARHSAWGIACNESQRQAIYLDPTYGDGQMDGGSSGLAVARGIAMLSYRSYEGYVSTQTEASDEKTDDFRAASYQRYQGEKLSYRFDAYAYVALTRSMDSHHLGRGRESLEAALAGIGSRTLVVGISSDQLFPVSEQKFLSQHIPRADYVQIDSAFGHDGFLIETKKLSAVIGEFLEGNYRNIRHTVFKSTVKKNQLMNLVGTR